MFVLPTFGLGVVASPTVIAVDAFNVTTRGTEENILDASNTPTNPSGEVNIAFGTDTKDFYIYYDGDWYTFNNDS